MAVSTPSRLQHSDNDSLSSPDTGSGGFIAVNRASSNDSDSSGRNSYPPDNKHNDSSHTTSPSYTKSNKQEQSSNKRKRTHSDATRSYSPQRQYDYSPPKRVEHPQHVADRALHVLGNGDQNAYYPQSNGAEKSTHNWNADKSIAPQHTQGQDQDDRPQTANSDSDLIEVLRPDNPSVEKQIKPWESKATSNGLTSHEDYGQENVGNGSNQNGPKRKRNFSNRTKTGCMTCRKRKKKCDEQHPVCNNCVRGGFECQGYSVARSGLWTKQTSVKPPVPLQSKDGSPLDPPEASIYRPSNSSPGSKRSSIHVESSQMRPIPMDEHENSNYGTSPQSGEPRTRPSYPSHQWLPQQGQPTYTHDHLPPLNEYPRSEGPSNPAPRDMSRPAPGGPPPHPHHQQPSGQSQTHPPVPGSHPGYWPPPQPTQQDYRHHYIPPPPPPRPEPPNVSHSHVRMPSANFEPQKSGAKTFTVEEVERSRMLRHSRYNHFDPTLQNERQRCERALERYNNACQLDSGLSEEDARNMLWKVVDPTRDNTHAFLAPCKERGLLSHGVKIEGPFRCTYGYNLKIMDNVYIGKNCNIDDAAKVEIGPRTWIGPNVTILTTDVGKDMVDRKGTGGAWYASPVYIASEVVIGANAVIYPGVRLERGSTVEPFALVRESLPENQTQLAPVGGRMV